MRVLIVGSGGREHAMAWHCAQGEHVHEVIVVTGNHGAETWRPTSPTTMLSLQALSASRLTSSLLGPNCHW